MKPSRRLSVHLRISALLFQSEGAYFLCLNRVTTRVITAQSIITNVNKSAYVTIGTSSLLLYPVADIIAPSALLVSIFYCQCTGFAPVQL